MYASQWFLTLFTAKFPLYMVFHIIDLLLCEVIFHSYLLFLSALFTQVTCSFGVKGVSCKIFIYLMDLILMLFNNILIISS